jgi:hypothetical protein
VFPGRQILTAAGRRNTNRDNDLRRLRWRLQGLATGGKNSHLDSSFKRHYGRRCRCVRAETLLFCDRETSVKNKLMLGAVLFALSLPMWAEPRGWFPPPPPPPPKRTPLPEGGNWQAYSIVSGAALLAGLMLARKRETETIADRS